MAVEWNLAELTVEELLSMAVILEEKGYDFYTALIENSPQRSVKNEIRFLCEEEAKHKAVFQDMLKKRGKPASGAPGAALEKILRQEIIIPLEDLLSSKKIASRDDALRFGVAMEKKSIELYTALAALPAAASLAEELAAIVAQEEGHLRTLTVMMAY
jgi:rubrerythrin